MIAEGRVDELIDAAAAIVAARGYRGGALAAIGLATVDAERAAVDLGAEPPAEAWAPAARDALLGARATIRSIAVPRRPGVASTQILGDLSLPDRIHVVLLEPDTEGRLAAFLARHGEEVAAAYVRPASGDSDPRRGGTPGRDVSPDRGIEPGPLGPEWLLPGGPPWGPHVILLEPDGRTGGTIAP